MQSSRPEETPRPSDLPPPKETASPALQSMSTGLPLTAGAWSSATSTPHAAPAEADTPLPHERSRLGQVFHFFRRRAVSTSSRSVGAEGDAAGCDGESLHSLKAVKDQARKYISEVEELHKRLALTEAELAAREISTRMLEETNAHAQELLQRNSELELLIAQVQDEADGQLKDEKAHHAKSQSDLRVSNDKVAELMAVITQLKAAKLAAPQATQLTEELTSLRLLMTDHEVDLCAVRAELAQAKDAALSLQEQLEREQQTIRQLQEDRRTQLSSISAVGDELEALLKQNESLDKQLKTSRDEHEALLQQHRQKQREFHEQIKHKNRQIAQGTSNLQWKDRDLTLVRGQLEELQKENLRLLEQAGEREQLQLKNAQLSALVAQAGERRKLESEYHEASVQRLQERLAHFENVQARAAAILARNSDLEGLVRELRQRVGALSQGPEGSGVLKQLREDVRLKTLQLSSAQEKLRTQASDLGLLERKLEELRHQLHLAEAATDKLRQLQSVGAKDDRSWQEAVDKVMVATREDARSEIGRVVAEYDALVRSIREAHAKELRRREQDFVARIRAVEQTEVDQSSAVQKQQALERQLAAAQSDMRTMMLRKEQEFEVYKEEFEKALMKLQAHKIQDIRDQLTQKEAELRKLELDVAVQAQRLRNEHEKQIQEIRKAHDIDTTDKERIIGQLQADQAALAEKMALREAELDAEVKREANIVAERLLDSYKAEFDSWMRKVKDDHEADVRRIRADLQSLLDESRAVNDKLKLDHEIDTQNLRRDHEQRMEDLRSSINGLVAKATENLSRDLEMLEKQLVDARRERDAATDDNLRLNREVNKLRAGVSERDTEISRLLEQSKTMETSTLEQCKELERLSKLLGATGSGSETDKRAFAELCERNVELEELVSTISEKYHDEMQRRMQASESVTALSLQHESKLKALEERLQSVKEQKEALRSVHSTAVDSRVSLEQRVTDLVSQLSQIESDRLQAIAELEAEQARVNSLKQQLHHQNLFEDDRRKLRTQLLNKIKALEILREPLAVVHEDATELEKETARLSAEKKKLQTEVDSLKTLVHDRQKTITQLEKSLRHSHEEQQSKMADKAAESEQLKSLQAERRMLIVETELLQNSLGQQKKALDAELALRDSRLKSLTQTNESLSVALEQNSELERTVRSLLDRVRQSVSLDTPPRTAAKDSGFNSPSSDRGEYILEVIDQFESEIRAQADAHERDLKHLSDLVEGREMVISTLKLDMRALRDELARNHAEQLKSQEVQFQSQLTRIESERDDMKEKKRMLEADLLKLQAELKDAQDFSAERVNELIGGLTRKLRDHEMTIAEIQTEQAEKDQRHETLMKISQTVQKELQAEVDRVTAELKMREGDILSLSELIKQTITTEGLEDEELKEILEALEHPGSQPKLASERMSTERWARLMVTFEQLFDKLCISQKSARDLLQMLNALLQEQQASLAGIAASQAAAAQTQHKMFEAVVTKRKSDRFSSSTELRPSAVGLGDEVCSDLSSVGDGLATLRSELQLLRKTRESLGSPLNMSQTSVVKRSVASGESTRATTTSHDEQQVSGKRFRLSSADDEVIKRARLSAD